MFKNILLVLVFLTVTACAPSPIQLTTTANAVLAQTETAAPISAATPSPTLTPTPTTTPTETPIPTPLGGGSGKLIFPLNTYFQEGNYFTLSSIYQVNSNGTNLKQILSRIQIESIVGNNPQRIHYVSFSGENYFVADGDLYIISDDWELIGKVDLNVGQISIYKISPEKTYFVYETTSRYKFIANLDGLETKLLFGVNDHFVGLSADDTTIYFTRNSGSQMWSVNSNGSNKHQLELAALNNFTPNEGISTPEGVISTRYIRRIDTIATASDKKQVAFTWEDLLFVSDATDLEFLNPRLITKLPEKAYSLVWSPNGDYLLVRLYFCENGGCNSGDIVLINVIQNRVERVFSSEEYQQAELCGFSPDSKQIIFHLYAKGSIRLVERDGNSSVDIQNASSCPIWQ